MHAMTRGDVAASRRAEEPPRASLVQRTSAAILVVAPLAALVFAVVTLWGHGISLLDVVIGVVMYCVTCFGVTVGFHRLLAHRRGSRLRAGNGTEVGGEGPVLVVGHCHRPSGPSVS